MSDTEKIKQDIKDIKEVLCLIHDYGQFLNGKPPEVTAKYNKLYRKWMKEGEEE